MEKTKVKIVIPIYTTELSAEEWRSLHRMAEVLGRYPVMIVVPVGVNAGSVAALFPECSILPVSDEWLGKKNGISGYNAMMMSRTFYELFLDTEYILVSQTDAWIFSDSLSEWCEKGYDYVGAPAPRKPIYNLLPVRWYLAMRRKLARGVLRQDLFVKRGYNGGLSLRRVDSFIHACEAYHARAVEFIANSHHLYNEDVFWSLIPQEFVYPDVKEAARFAFDIKPEVCYRLTGEELPFGCHGWFKEPMAGFWRGIIC